MTEIKTRDSVIVYFGKSRVKGIVIGQYEPELFKNVFWIQLEDGSFIDAHRFQVRKLRKKRTLYVARFRPPTINADGFSFPMQSLEEAKRLAERQHCIEILECVEVRTIKAPPMPEFLKKPIDSTAKVP